MQCLYDIELQLVMCLVIMRFADQDDLSLPEVIDHLCVTDCFLVAYSENLFLLGACLCVGDGTVLPFIDWQSSLFVSGNCGIMSSVLWTWVDAPDVLI